MGRRRRLRGVHGPLEPPAPHAFIEWLQPQTSAHWLEVGCGTGALTSAICDVASPASVVACDPSEAFIEHARNRLPSARASFVVGGSEAVPDRDGGFDLIVSGLVLNFLPDPDHAIAAFRERLAPGRTVSAYVWDYAQGMEFLRYFWDETVASDPRAAELDEARRFPLCDRWALESLFRTSGLQRVKTALLDIPTDFADFDDYWTPFLRGTGPAPGYVASLDPPRRELLSERLRLRLRADSDGRIRLRARAWAVSGSID